MKRLLIATISAALVSMTTGYTTPASASSPIFGNAKVAMLSTDAAKKVTAKGGTTAMYLYYGLLYTSNAIYYAGLAQYNNYYGGNGSSGVTTNYALYAWQDSYRATSAFNNAYIYSWYGQ